MDIFNLYRHFWDYAFSNPERIKPNHVAVYSFAVEHCNRLGWKDKFGLPSSMVMEATGIKSYSVFKKTFDELVNYGLFEIIEYSKNQYSSNIIALKENCKANSKASYKALDKALTKHLTKHKQSTLQSTESIDIQLYNSTIIQTNNNTNIDADFFNLISDKQAKYISNLGKEWNLKEIWQIREILKDFNDYLIESYKKHPNIESYINHFANWGKTRFLSYQNIPDPDADMKQIQRELDETRQRNIEREKLIQQRQKEQDERDAKENEVNS